MSDAHESSGSISYGYEDPEDAVPAMNNKKMTTPGTFKKGSAGSGGFRVSSLPASLRDSVAKMNLDKNGDGELDCEEIGQVVENLTSTHKVNKFLKLMVGGLCVFAMLLVGCVFGATLAAARLTKDTDVDSLTGIMYARQSGSDDIVTTMKTAEVIFYSDASATTIMDMSNDDLKSLKEILLADDAVKFQVKGYARAKDNTYTTVLVEGGTIVYDINGLASATGDAKILLDSAFGEQQQGEGDDVDVRGRRYLMGCFASTAASTSATTAASTAGSTAASTEASTAGSTEASTAAAYDTAYNNYLNDHSISNCGGSYFGSGNSNCAKGQSPIAYSVNNYNHVKCCGRYENLILDANNVATCHAP